MKYPYIFNQLRDWPPENIRRLFLDFEATVRNFGDVDLDRYFTADRGIVEAPDPVAACERLFCAYNADHRPDGYTGRSMSVGDVVTLWDISVEPPQIITWFCDGIGFKLLNSELGTML